MLSTFVRWYSRLRGSPVGQIRVQIGPLDELIVETRQCFENALQGLARQEIVDDDVREWAAARYFRSLRVSSNRRRKSTSVSLVSGSSASTIRRLSARFTSSGRVSSRGGMFGRKR